MSVMPHAAQAAPIRHAPPPPAGCCASAVYGMKSRFPGSLCRREAEFIDRDGGTWCAEHGFNENVRRAYGPMRSRSIEARGP